MAGSRTTSVHFSKSLSDVDKPEGGALVSGWQERARDKRKEGSEDGHDADDAPRDEDSTAHRAEHSRAEEDQDGEELKRRKLAHCTDPGPPTRRADPEPTKRLGGKKRRLSAASREPQNEERSELTRYRWSHRLARADEGLEISA